MPAWKPVATGKLEEHDLSEELMLFNGQEDQVHVLNRSARFIWKLCDGTHTEEDILREVREHFHAQEERNLPDEVRMILEAFRRIGLVV